MPTEFAITFTASFRVSWKSVEREEIVDQKATIMVIHFDNYSYLKKIYTGCLCLVSSFHKLLGFFLPQNSSHDLTQVLSLTPTLEGVLSIQIPSV